MIRAAQLTQEQRARWKKYGREGGAPVEQCPLQECRLSDALDAGLDVQAGDLVEVKLGTKADARWVWAVVWDERARSNRR